MMEKRKEGEFIENVTPPVKPKTIIIILSLIIVGLVITLGISSLEKTPEVKILESEIATQKAIIVNLEKIINKQEQIISKHEIIIKNHEEIEVIDDEIQRRLISQLKRHNIPMPD